MAGGGNYDDDEPITSINVVPLVDIMLVLLIIFMVTTEFVQNELKNKMPLNVPVELPGAATSEETNPTLLSLVINGQGELFLGGKPATLQDVRERVAELKAKGKKLEAVIAADKRLRHEQVIEVIDVLRQMEVAKVAINTKKQEIE